MVTCSLPPRRDRLLDDRRDARPARLRPAAQPERGRAAQSREIGTALRRLGIPIGDVLASPYCRTRDTARLAFGRFRSSDALLSARYVTSRPARAGQPARLRRLLGARPRRGTNTVLVSHAFAVDDAAGVNLAEGEVAVAAHSAGKEEFEIVATVEPGEWAAIARRSRPPRVALREYRVFEGAGLRDVAPAHDGTVWFTAQAAGELGRLEPRSGRVRRVRWARARRRTA